MTLNDLERRSSLYFASIHRIRPTDYITVVEDRPIIILSPSSSLLLLAKTIATLQRGLSAIAEHFVYFVETAISQYIILNQTSICCQQ